MDFSAIVNLDLFSVGVALAAIANIGFLVILHNRHSRTGKAFLFLSAAAVSWSIVNYISYQTYNSATALWLLRFVMFFAIWYAFGIFNFIYIFNNAAKANIYYKFGLLPFVVFTSLLTLTPLVFTRIIKMPAAGGGIPQVAIGPGIVLFGLTAGILLCGAVFLVLRKIAKASGVERIQLFFISIGLLLTFGLHILFNFIYPAFLNNQRFIPLGAVFIFPFIAFTFYAINKHGLLNVKIISTEILVFLLAIAALLEIIFSSDIVVLVMRISVFLLVIALGILLIRSVRKEVEQRERLQTLSEQLSAANEELKRLDAAKSEFISIASHQLRAPLTVIKGYISLLLEGSLGAITEQTREAFGKVAISAEQLVKLIGDLLNLSRIESGKIKYEFILADFSRLVEEVVNEFRPHAEKKNCTLIFKNNFQNLPQFKFDPDKMREVVINFTDNAIKYSTPPGLVEISIDRSRIITPGVRLRVTDNGIGLKPEDMSRLFTKFVRTEEAQRTDPNGMGIGLYFVKRVAEDHGGKAWAESAGPGKGSTFIVEVPLRQ